MDWRNRIGLYGSYFLGMAGVGFTLPYLTVFLKDRGFSDLGVGLLATFAAVAGLLQFPVGLWSDRVQWRKPFIVVLLAVLAAATLLLYWSREWLWVSFLVLLFAENGACRATVESLAGAEATHLAAPGRLGWALGMLRIWRPAGIVLMALAGSVLADWYGVDAILLPLTVVQTLAVGCALLLHEGAAPAKEGAAKQVVDPEAIAGAPAARGLRDSVLWTFVAAMVLFHVSNAPGGVYLSPFLLELKAPKGLLPLAFVIDMVTWTVAVWPAGWLADRIGRRPVIIAAWAAMTLRMVLVSLAQAPWQVLAIEVLDGLAQSLFAVVAASWMTDRLADPRRAGQAQALVGSALVFGSAIGPTLAGLVVGALHYRGMFGVLAGVGAAATLLVVAFVPETRKLGAPSEEKQP